MIFYCIEVTAPGSDKQNAWVTRSAEALRMARTFGPAAESIRVVKVTANGKDEVAELLNTASGIVDVLVGGEVIWRSEDQRKNRPPRQQAEHQQAQ